MRSIVRTGLLAFACAAMSGCVTYAETPKGAVFGDAYAEAEFRLGVDDTVGLGAATVQEYRVSQVESFASGQTVKIFTWAAKQPKTHLLAAGQNVYVFAQMRDIGTSEEVTCEAGSSFTPQARTRYEVYLARMASGCRLEIRDRASGLEPTDLKRVMYPIPA